MFCLVPKVCEAFKQLLSGKKNQKRRLFKEVQSFREEKKRDTDYGYMGMLNRKTNVGKLKNGVFCI